MCLRKALTPKQKSNSEIIVKEDDKESDEDDKDGSEDYQEGNEDDAILKEMEEMTNALERKKKRERKLLAKKRAKVVSYLVSQPIILNGYLFRYYNYNF